MKVAEIRSSFLSYFADKAHQVVESSSLVPANDPSLLFTNAGMVPFKDCFLGREKRSYTRAASCQKCVRAGGKHNDLENVGFTARHHTFFEMLGNFSFGDYFKKEAIDYAWGFVREILKLPEDRLYVTVFRDDDEAYDLWNKHIGIDASKIFRLGEADNFWAMGDTGPCGPCSEIFFDRGEQLACSSECGIGKCECDRFMEFWNLVFMQFERDAEGNLSALPSPSVDTGMGLERIASILQETNSNYEIDSFRAILEYTASLLSRSYSETDKDVFAFRVIADHARAACFLVGDGVVPGNEGRSYVLRRIIRRAIRFGRNLGFDGAFLYKVCEKVIEQMQEAYPDLLDKKSFILQAVEAEEEQFFRTLERGLQLLDEALGELSADKQLPGEIAFKLYDTFGFPLDLTRIICAEKNISIDELGFEKAMEHQKTQSRQGWKGSGDGSISQVYHEILEALKSNSTLPEFVGYDLLASEGSCLALIGNQNGEKARVASFSTPGAELEAVFSPTPFYGESGGQAGDRGVVRSKDGSFEAQVLDVQKPLAELTVVRLKLIQGTVKVGETYEQLCHEQERALTARNHTATHMLHWALRDVLGDHVKQAGSLVNAQLLRFDFTHFKSLSDEELTAVESKVNERIFNAQNVTKKLMDKESAIEAGAIAFFGEKYGDEVRVVSVGDFSVELCGGTHVENTAEINLFKIYSESSIASGVRRIIAYTSKRAFEYLSEREKESSALRTSFKANSGEELLSKIDKLISSEKDLKKQIEQLRSKNLAGEIDEIIAQAELVGDIKLVNYEVAADENAMKTLRELSDKLRQKDDQVVVVLGMKLVEESKVLLLVSKSGGVSKQIKAGDMVKELSPWIDGKGGGKPDQAQAGGSKLEGLSDVFKNSRSVLEKLMGS